MLGFEVFGQGNAAKFSLCVRVTRPGSSGDRVPSSADITLFGLHGLPRPRRLLRPVSSASARVICSGPHRPLRLQGLPSLHRLRRLHHMPRLHRLLRTHRLPRPASSLRPHHLPHSYRLFAGAIYVVFTVRAVRLATNRVVSSLHLYISTSSELPCRRSCRWRLRGSPPRGNPSCFLLSLPSRSRSRPCESEHSLHNGCHYPHTGHRVGARRSWILTRAPQIPLGLYIVYTGNRGPRRPAGTGTEART